MDCVRVIITVTIKLTFKGVHQAKEWSADRQTVIAQLAVSNITTKQELMRTAILSAPRKKVVQKWDLIKEEQQEERYNWIGKLKWIGQVGEGLLRVQQVQVRGQDCPCQSIKSAGEEELSVMTNLSCLPLSRHTYARTESREGFLLILFENSYFAPTAKLPVAAVSAVTQAV